MSYYKTAELHPDLRQVTYVVYHMFDDFTWNEHKIRLSLKSSLNLAYSHRVANMFEFSTHLT